MDTGHVGHTPTVQVSGTLQRGPMDEFCLGVGWGVPQAHPPPSQPAQASQWEGVGVLWFRPLQKKKEVICVYNSLTPSHDWCSLFGVL